MTFDTAIRLTEIFLGLVFIQQSFEHLISQPNPRYLFGSRLILSILLIIGLQWSLYGLLILSINILYRFQGPYNGGNDRMGLLILICLCLVSIAPNQYWREIALGYLAMQLILSYFIAGSVKLMNPEWWSGRALRDVFEFSAYPISESLRGWSKKTYLLCFMSWAVIGFEILFPFALLSESYVYLALFLGGIFHFANACLFGFNRFFWIWLAAYPSLLWLQERIF